MSGLYCSEQLHHIIPIKQGGNNGNRNLQILHSHCHKAKHKKLHKDT
ncbi:MAG: HNH endonuclease [Moorea sp. SIO2I5]|nr:HNH endonuclease [Moorena sp. SIO2I5]